MQGMTAQVQTVTRTTIFTAADATYEPFMPPTRRGVPAHDSDDTEAEAQRAFAARESSQFTIKIDAMLKEYLLAIGILLCTLAVLAVFIWGEYL
jgi:hypothetical protein